jgi:hypothetical protein
VRINLLPCHVNDNERRFAYKTLAGTGQLITYDKDLARSWAILLNAILVVWWPDRWYPRMFEPLVIEVMPYSCYRHHSFLQK